MPGKEPTPEELDERQRRMGTKRKPAGPPSSDSPGTDEAPCDVPPTEVITPKEGSRDD